MQARFGQRGADQGGTGRGPGGAAEGGALRRERPRRSLATTARGLATTGPRQNILFFFVFCIFFKLSTETFNFIQQCLKKNLKKHPPPGVPSRGPRKKPTFLGSPFVETGILYL